MRVRAEQVEGVADCVDRTRRSEQQPGQAPPREHGCAADHEGEQDRVTNRVDEENGDPGCTEAGPAGPGEGVHDRLECERSAHCRRAQAGDGAVEPGCGEESLHSLRSISTIAVYARG